MVEGYRLHLQIRRVENGQQQTNKSVKDHEAFGMWRDRKDMADVDAYVRNMRKI